MELRDYARILRRRWASILAVTALVVAAAAAYTFAATPIYASSASLYVSTSDAESTSESYQGGLLSAQKVTSFAELATSRRLAEAVAADLDGVDADELPEKVSAEVKPETVILTLTAEDPDPELAQALAQTYAEAMTDLVRLVETGEGEESAAVRATIVDSASEPEDPVSPQPLRNLGLGLVLGLLLGVGIAVLREVLDTTISGPDDIAAASDAPLLGSTPFDSSARSRPLVTDLDSHAPRVEAFRVLRTNLQFVDVDVQSKLFVVTSAVPSEGKTTTSVNLAVTLAQAGTKTLLVECDLRRPKASAMLDVDHSVGVTTVLVGKVALDDVIVRHDATGLDVLPGGAIPPNPAELVQSRAMAELLAELRNRYDVVILDAPPLLPVTDAALLAAQSDGALLVVRHGKTTRDQLAQAVDRLSAVDAQPVGLVLNMAPARGRRTGYGYGYGYAPEQPDQAAKRRRRG